MTIEINNTKSKTNLIEEGGKNQHHQKPTLKLYMKLIFYYWCTKSDPTKHTNL